MGLFLSINGWSDNVPLQLQKNKSLCIILMNSIDLDYVLRGKVNLQDLIKAKIQHLSYKTEPYYGAEQYLVDTQ